MLKFNGYLIGLLILSSHCLATNHEGSSGGFYDFEEQGMGAKITEWNSNAPAWRKCIPGASLIGTCTNRHCEAYGRKVISGLGYGRHAVIKENRLAAKCKCPICEEAIIPTTCSFNKCFFKATGRKSANKCTVITEWKYIGDQCLIYDELGNTAHYSGLMIEASSWKKDKPVDNDLVSDVAISPSSWCAFFSVSSLIFWACCC